MCSVSLYKLKGDKMGMFSKFAPLGLKNYSFSENSPKTGVVLIVLY